MEGRADAVPTTRNYTPDSPDLDERRGQPLRSAMARSRPGGTALMITVTQVLYCAPWGRCPFGAGGIKYKAPVEVPDLGTNGSA